MLTPIWAFAAFRRLSAAATSGLRSKISAPKPLGIVGALISSPGVVFIRSPFKIKLVSLPANKASAVRVLIKLSLS